MFRPLGRCWPDVIQSAPARIELDGAERVVTLTDGTQLRADQVLVGIGITPNTALAEAMGLEVNDGVVVDERQQTSNAAVFAVGDAARIRTAGCGEVDRVVLL
ncbi:FAD-dependent oxidoreductase [Micrococcoides hystricis]|uniref:FAD-dependent oxidoreductase n=1 Tax=Micrococcoides hystricis TaxID=1572761 RepID=A0ABV6PA72_9MICC